MYLRKFSEPLGNPDADTLRNVTLSIVIRDACEGDLAFNQAAADEYLARSGFFKLKGKAWDNASFLSRSEFTVWIIAPSHIFAQESTISFGNQVC